MGLEEALILRGPLIEPEPPSLRAANEFPGIR